MSSFSLSPGRPARPAAERRLVREFARSQAKPDAPRAPIARALAARVVDHLRELVAEGSDPMMAAVSEKLRRAFPTPATMLATDPDVDTLALYVEARVEQLRNRNGCPLSPVNEQAEVSAAFAAVENRLALRYLKHLRRNAG